MKYIMAAIAPIYATIITALEMFRKSFNCFSSMFQSIVCNLSLNFLSDLA